MIPAAKIFEAFRTAVGAARTVMEGRGPVLVDDVLAAEGCSCSTPRVVGVHNRGADCGDAQHDLIALSVSCIDTIATLEALDVLAEEADRRDGVRRGPR